MIVIRLSDGCIGIYQLLTATICIVPNSLLPFNLEENGFMKEYYEHPRVWTDYKHWYGKCKNGCVSTVKPCINTLEICHVMLFQMSNSLYSWSRNIWSIFQHWSFNYISHLSSNCTLYNTWKSYINWPKICQKCKQDCASEQTTKIYTRKYLVMMETTISNFHTSLYIP